MAYYNNPEAAKFKAKLNFSKSVLSKCFVRIDLLIISLSGAKDNPYWNHPTRKHL